MQRLEPLDYTCKNRTIEAALPISPIIGHENNPASTKGQRGYDNLDSPRTATVPRLTPPYREKRKNEDASMPDAVKEAVAKVLYARWCTNCDSDDGWEPDWAAFENGDSLNGGYGLFADTFRNEAEFIAPYDNAVNVGRRLCWYHCIAVAADHACKSPEACAGLEEWQQRTVDAIMEAVESTDKAA